MEAETSFVWKLVSANCWGVPKTFRSLLGNSRGEVNVAENALEAGVGAQECSLSLNRWRWKMLKLRS